MSKQVVVNPDAIAQKRGEKGAGTPSQPSPTMSRVASGQDLKEATEKWKPPVLKYGFDLDEAKEKAYRMASMYMNKVLSVDDMSITMELEEGRTVGNVHDTVSGNVVRTYEGTDVLKLYANNFKERGIIVDGNV